MARKGKKNRPLACVNVSYALAPTYRKDTGKFETPIPEMRVLNKEVIDIEDGELGLATPERINIQAQIDAGLLTVEDVVADMEYQRLVWNNHILMQEQPQ